MFSKILYLCISTVYIATITEGTGQKKSFPNNLLSPININTAKVISVDVAKPFTLYFETDSMEIVKNTGSTITFYPLPFTRTHITNGLLGNNTYKVYKNFLNINQNPNGRCASTINGKKYPVAGVVVFFNEKYGTYKNALNYNDGLVVITELVEVNSKPNPDFEQFEKILLSKILREPNSATVTSTKNIFSWYSTFAISHSYYVYQGVYYDPETKKPISRATQVVTQPPYNHISYEQHAAFKNVLGFDRDPIETITPIYPQKNRTVLGSNKVKSVSLPFSGIVFLLQIAYVLIFGTST